MCRITKYHCWQKHWELIHCGFWAFPIYHKTAAMKIDRLMGIVTILLQQGKVTAPELARRFEVSRRTINRDIEDICKAGIPLVTTQGAGGGISIMEGYSMEDEGAGICFCVYAYNVQPGVQIDYATGNSELMATPEPEPTPEEEQTAPAAANYIGNANTKKFHKPGCSSIKQMKESNKVELSGTREEIISMGYEPCKKCNP